MRSEPTVIRFFAPINDATINALMNAIDQKMKQGVHHFTILISSPGGSVFHGLSAYNCLKGLPASVTTHNFGSVDSIGVGAAFRNERLEEKQLEERLKGLRIDTENIARVIAANTGKTLEEVIESMLERTTLNPNEAKAWGLVHDVTSELSEAGSEVISIVQEQRQEQ